MKLCFEFRNVLLNTSLSTGKNTESFIRPFSVKFVIYLTRYVQNITVITVLLYPNYSRCSLRIVKSFFSFEKYTQFSPLFYRICHRIFIFLNTFKISNPSYSNILAHFIHSYFFLELTALFRHLSNGMMNDSWVKRHC